jgi:hypothetical protein
MIVAKEQLNEVSVLSPCHERVVDDVEVVVGHRTVYMEILPNGLILPFIQNFCINCQIQSFKTMTRMFGQRLHDARSIKFSFSSDVDCMMIRENLERRRKLEQAVEEFGIGETTDQRPRI